MARPRPGRSPHRRKSGSAPEPERTTRSGLSGHHSDCLPRCSSLGRGGSRGIPLRSRRSRREKSGRIGRVSPTNQSSSSSTNPAQPSGGKRRVQQARQNASDEPWRERGSRRTGPESDTGRTSASHGATKKRRRLRGRRSSAADRAKSGRGSGSGPQRCSVFGETPRRYRRGSVHGRPPRDRRRHPRPAGGRRERGKDRRQGDAAEPA